MGTVREIIVYSFEDYPSMSSVAAPTYGMTLILRRDFLHPQERGLFPRRKAWETGQSSELAYYLWSWLRCDKDHPKKKKR